MLYVSNISTDASTTKQNYKSTIIKVWKGVIHEIDILIPSGHKGLAKLQVFHGGHIIMPTNEDGEVKGNDSVINGRFFIDLKKEVNLIEVRTWNDDTFHVHEFIVRIGVLPKLALVQVGATEGIIESIKSLVIRPLVLKQELKEVI